MNRENYKKLLERDKYLVKRKHLTDVEYELFLHEVDYSCPICGKILQHSKQKKSNRQYHIAHIYPNKPTPKQYKTLQGLERLGENCESFENKIALCKDCHGTQDYHTTKEDYLNLLQKKKFCLTLKEIREATISLGLEDEIAVIVSKMVNIKEADLEKIKNTPIALTNKFTSDELLLKNIISANVTLYYPYIRELFKNIEGKNNFTFETLAGQIRCCFVKMSQISEDKNKIYEQMSNWIKLKTGSQSKLACDAVISFFVQNCEVFNEITE